MRKRVAFVALLLLLQAGIALGAELSEQEKLRYAATQHEILSILIEEGQYESVLDEFRKIVELELANQTLVIQEVGIITGRLMEHKQFALAHQIAGVVIAQSEDRESRFALLMIQGKIYKQEGKLKDAVRVYRQAQQLND